ncbi:MAG: Gfo/Idh/MocA family oxidoreductase [Armatimonadota bacterium]|jgi:predicted dehydrogenase
MKETKKPDMSRRRFIKTAAAGTAAVSSFGIMSASAQDERPLKAALIGCGGRGSGAVIDLHKADANVSLVAMADLFGDKLDASVERLQKRKVAADNVRRLTGFDAYKQVLDMDVDIVLLATPPFFRPEQFAAAVDAGKHVFMEKPVAVDPVGARLIMETGEKAKQKGLSVVAGTQRRHQRSYIETKKQVDDGVIGEIAATRAAWCGNPVRYFPREAGWSDMEYQIRSWFNFLWLAGDHILEQHIHNVDVCNWFVGTHPVKAFGMGARVRRRVGDTYDFFAVDYEYENGVHCDSRCRQIVDCDRDVSEYVIGAEGIAACHRAEIRDSEGAPVWRYQGPAKPTAKVQEHIDLTQAIRTEKPVNDAQNVAESTMTAIMGRTSAYTGKVVTWDEIMASDMRLGPEPPYEMGDLPPTEVQLPGRPWPEEV